MLEYDWEVTLQIDAEMQLNNLVISPQNWYIIGVRGNGKLEIWDLETGNLVKTLMVYVNEKPGLSSINSLHLLRDGKRALLATQNGLIQVVELPTGKILRTIPGPEEGFSHAILSQDETDLVVSAQKIYVKDFSTGTVKKILEGHEKVVNTSAFSPDGKTLVSGGRDGKIIAWDIASGQAQWTYESLSQDLFGDEPTIFQEIYVTPTGKVVSYGPKDWYAQVVDLTTGKLLHKTSGLHHAVSSLAVSPDGQLVVTSSKDNVLCMCEVETGEVAYELPLDEPAEIITFSPNGRILAFKSGGKIGIIDDINVRKTEERAPYDILEPVRRKLQVSDRISFKFLQDFTKVDEENLVKTAFQWALDCGLLFDGDDLIVSPTSAGEWEGKLIPLVQDRTRPTIEHWGRILRYALVHDLIDEERYNLIKEKIRQEGENLPENLPFLIPELGEIYVSLAASHARTLETLISGTGTEKRRVEEKEEELGLGSLFG